MTTLGSGVNQIESFALGVGANVESPSTWASDTVRQQGFQNGIANPAQANTALRQALFIASMIAQFSADFSGAPCDDDGNVTNAEQNFINALSAALAVQGIYFITDTGSANAMIGTSSNGPSAYTSPCLVIVKKMSAANTGAMTANFWGLGQVALTDNTGAALSSGALIGNAYYVLAYGGGGFHVMGGTTSYTSVTNLTANTGDMIQVTTGGVVNCRVGTAVHSAVVGAGDMWPRGNASDDTCRFMTTTEFLAFLLGNLSVAPVITAFTSSGTWTPSAVKTKALIFATGGGGGGGAGYGNGGGGGGGGGTAISYSSTSGLGAQTVTIGAAGAGGVNSGYNNGGTGGTTSVGALAVAAGGIGGYNTSNLAIGGVGGASSTANLLGLTGGVGTDSPTSMSMVGQGGGSFFGQGGAGYNPITIAAATAGQYGGGGGGGFNGLGGNGGQGLALILEF